MSTQALYITIGPFLLLPLLPGQRPDLDLEVPGVAYSVGIACDRGDLNFRGVLAERRIPGAPIEGKADAVIKESLI